MEGTGVIGVWGESSYPTGLGVAGRNDNGIGVEGDGKTGVRGYSFGGNGVEGVGRGANKAGVLGQNRTGYGGHFEGGKAQLMLKPGSSVGAPTGAHSKGEVYMDAEATLWVCWESGNPARWKRITTS